MYHTQSQQASDLRTYAQRAAARTKTMQDILPSKGLLVDWSADSRVGVKGE